MKYDIAVVGGGPAGLSAAYAAASAGCRVSLFERDDSIGHNIRTSGVTWISEMKELGIPQEYCNPIKNYCFISPNNEVTLTADSPYCCVLDVRRTYQYLGMLAASAGAEIMVRSNVYDIKLDRSTSNRRIRFKSLAGEKELQSTIIIDASGFRAEVGQKLGLINAWSRYGAGAEYECYCDDVDPETWYLMVGSRYSAAGYAWAFPVNKNRIRIGVGVGRPDTTEDPIKKLNEIFEAKPTPLNRIKNLQPLEFHYGLIPNQGIVSRFVDDGIMLVGDSAGFSNPLLLEGIRHAIKFGRMAGQVAAASIPFNGSREHLLKYETDCKRILSSRTYAALRVQSRWLKLSDDEWDKELEILAALKMDEFLDFIKADFSPIKMLRLGLYHPKLMVRSLFSLVTDDKRIGV
jgi:digeranylgeranylglycerophospholipid reductase